MTKKEKLRAIINDEIDRMKYMVVSIELNGEIIEHCVIPKKQIIERVKHIDKFYNEDLVYIQDENLKIQNICFGTDLNAIFKHLEVEI